VARTTGQRWALARAAHGRALLAEGAEAGQAFIEALDHHGRATRPFERARTEPAFGVALRRARRRADARTHLRAAFDGFEQLARSTSTSATSSPSSGSGSRTELVRFVVADAHVR
jgi:hypothetical protein